MAKAKSEAVQSAEAVVYIGPGTSGGGLLMQYATIYKGGLPAPVAARCAEDSAFAALFVPVSQVATARQEIKREGTTLNRAAQAVAAKYRGAK